MKLNVWGGEESYSVSLEQEEGKSGANLVMYILYFHSFSFSTVLCCWQQGWKEEKKERGEV